MRGLGSDKGGHAGEVRALGAFPREPIIILRPLYYSASSRMIVLSVFTACDRSFISGIHCIALYRIAWYGMRNGTVVSRFAIFLYLRLRSAPPQADGEPSPRQDAFASGRSGAR